MNHTKFTKQWGKRPSIRHINSKVYHFQESHRTKHEAQESVEHYRGQGRLARVFKHVSPEHPLKGRPATIIPVTTWFDVYVTVKIRGKS